MTPQLINLFLIRQYVQTAFAPLAELPIVFHGLLLLPATAPLPTPQHMTNN